MCYPTELPEGLLPPTLDRLVTDDPLEEPAAPRENLERPKQPVFCDTPMVEGMGPFDRGFPAPLSFPKAELLQEESPVSKPFTLQQPEMGFQQEFNWGFE